MDFNKGDLVAGVGISTGEYAGKTTVNTSGDPEVFHKVIESERGITHYLPCKKEETPPLRKLPSSETFKRYLRELKTTRPIEVGELEGSRYRFYKEKYLKGKLKSTLEVFHDLNIFHKQKKITASERKLFNDLTEKISTEMSFVLRINQDEAKKIILKMGIAA